MGLTLSQDNIKITTTKKSEPGGQRQRNSEIQSVGGGQCEDISLLALKTEGALGKNLSASSSSQGGSLFGIWGCGARWGPQS